MTFCFHPRPYRGLITNGGTVDCPYLEVEMDSLKHFEISVL